MEALSAVATIQKKNHATIILAVSFSIHVHILEACPNPDLVSGLLRIFSIFLRTVHRICQNSQRCAPLASRAFLKAPKASR